MIKKLTLSVFIVTIFMALAVFTGVHTVNAVATPDTSADADKSWILSFIESKISSPNRQIRFSNIQGVLSSSATIGAITVADREGVWLKITNAKMDWNRFALLRGQISINELIAEHIEVVRKPLPDVSVPSLQSKRFSIPDLPVAVSIKSLEAKNITFSEQLFGLSSSVSLKGGLLLADENLDSELTIKRLDAPGSFNVLVNISNSKNKAKIAIEMSEPENGIVANVLKIKNRPSVELTVNGDGPLDNLSLNLAMKAGTDPVLTGALKLKGGEKGKTVSVDLSGPIILLMPDEYHDFFGEKTELKLAALLKKEGGLRLDQFSINGDGIHVDANAETLADGFLRVLQVKAAIKAQSGDFLILPVAGGKTRADQIELNIEYGAKNTTMWNGQFVVNNFSNENFKAQDITVDMGGDAENLDNVTNRHVSVQISGAINGIATLKNKLSDALGKSVNIKVDADILGHRPISVHTINLTANGLTLWLKGEIDKLNFNGNLGIKANTLEPLAMLSGKPLSGSANIDATGTINFASGAFDLDLTGKTVALKTGNEIVDRLLAGDVTLTGGIKRDTDGITTRNFVLGNNNIKLDANGSFSSDEADMDVHLDLSDLALINPRMTGPISVTGALRGHNRLIAFSLGTRIDDVTLSGQKMQNTAIFANLILDNTSPIVSYLNGSVDGTGNFSGEKLELAASLTNNGTIKRLNDLNIIVGGTKVTGALSQNSTGLIDGNLHIDAPDISTLSALVLTDGHGSMKGDFVFNNDNGKQNAHLSAHIDKLVFGENHAENLDMNLALSDPMGTSRLNGYVNASGIRMANLIVNNMQAIAEDNNGQTAFHVTADVQNNIKANISGAVVYAESQTNDKPSDNRQLTINLDTVNVTQDRLQVKLTKPTSFIVFDKAYEITPMTLDVNGGKVSLAGSGGEKINFQVNMDHLPLSIANLLKTDLGAAGSLTGDAAITGTTKNPNIQFNVKGENLTVAVLSNKKIAPLTLDASGVTNGNTLSIISNLSGGGLDAQANGKIPLGRGNLDLDVVLKNLPVGLANGFVEGQDFGGSINGHVHIGGQLDNPTATFNLTGQGLKADLIARNGLAPISLNTAGTYDNSVLKLERLNADGPQELNISVNGTIPLKGNVDLHVKGSAPMAIANQFLAERGAQMAGSATIDATVRGSLAKPELNGNLSLSNGSFIDSQTNLRLNNIVVDASLSGERIVLNRANASSSAGGTIAANGSISTDFSAGMPADMTIQLNHARYSDGEMVVATVDGTVTLTGGLLHNPLIGGDLTIEKAEITVPDRFGGAALIDVKHKHLSKDIETTLERAKIDTGKKKINANTAKSSVAQLKMHIRAPNQIFVRGMGLDVELGGEIGLFGPINEIHPVGGFQMLRGRFEILSQRLTFTEGTVTLVGNLNPEVNFVATTQGSDITVTVTVSGVINSLNVAFSSTPVLPQDEVLARLIFNRSISELSPFQIAQLTSAAAQLAGVTNTSLLGSLRATTGLDDLDVVTDKQGNTGVRAGRYIRDNIYLGVEAGSGGNTKGTVNLDISKNLKAKGALGAQGDSSVGVFYEKDY